ncbi:MAG: hypothetical protein EDR02_03385 [Actinobacteria bacterium]|nr:MAG: hypothetical protein EDR02_03385 [Actinomycetota bacterium]
MFMHAGNRPRPIHVAGVAVVAALVVAVIALLVFGPTAEVQPLDPGADTPGAAAPGATVLAGLAGTAGDPGAEPQPDSGAAGTTLVVDESDLGTISLEVPSEWSDAVAGDMTDGSVSGREVTVSSDTEAYFEGFTTPGMWLAVVENPALDTTAFLDDLTPPAACTYEGRVPMSAENFEGHHEVYRNCGDAGSSYWVGAIQLGDHAVYFDANVPDATTEATVDAAIASLEVDQAV